jgi:hypothetical protein
MKTTLKKLAATAFIALLLLGGNVQAKGTEVNVSSHENIETSLKLESWMTSEKIWNNNFNINLVFVLETEESLKVENWMTNEETWEVSDVLAEENEKSLVIEDWMTSEKTWK